MEIAVDFWMHEICISFLTGYPAAAKPEVARFLSSIVKYQAFPSNTALIDYWKKL